MEWCPERQHFYDTYYLARKIILVPKVYPNLLNSDFWNEREKMKRDAQDQQKKRGKFEPSSDPLIAALPRLNELLTDCWWDDGKPRDVCSLSIRWDGDSVSVTLTDKEAQRSMTTTSTSAQEALEAMERHIEERGPAWRSWAKQKR